MSFYKDRHDLGELDDLFLYSVITIVHSVRTIIGCQPEKLSTTS